MLKLALFFAVLAGPLCLHAQSSSVDSASILVVRAFASAWQARNLEAVEKLLAERAAIFSAGSDSVVTVAARGKAAVSRMFRSDFMAADAPTVSVRSITTVGPWAAAHMSFTRTVAASSSDVMWLFVFEIRSEKIAQIFIYPARQTLRGIGPDVEQSATASGDAPQTPQSGSDPP